MKSGWAQKRLVEVATLQRGFDLPSHERSDGDVPLVSSSGVIDRHSKSAVAGPGVVTGRSGSIGKVFFIEKDFWPLNTTLYVKDFHGNDPRFIFHLLEKLELRRFATGTGVPTLNRNFFHDEPVNVPPLPEQQRIVAILDEAFAAIATAQAHAEKNLQNCISLWTSLLDSTLDSDNSDWLHRPLADLCSIRHGFAFDGEFFTSEGEFVLLTPGNFFETGGYRDRGMKQKYYRGEIPEGYILQEGDLLVAMTEQAAGLLGSPLIVPASERFLHNQRLGLVVGKPDAAWDNHFFYFVFNTTRVRREIHASASGVKVRHTSPSKIGEVVVSFPTELSQQRAIAARLTEMSEETQRLESIYRRRLTALDELKQSLLHQAFNGDL